MNHSQTSITMMDLHKLVFEVKGLGCIVDEDSGFWEQLEAQFSSFYSICKSIRSYYHFKVSSMSDFREDYSQLRRKAKERREGCRVAHYRDLEHGEFTGNYRAGRKMNVGCALRMYRLR